jgi:hypothetical protein
MDSRIMAQNQLRKQPKKGFLLQEQSSDEDLATDTKMSTTGVKSKKAFWSLKRRELLLDNPP